MSDESRNPDGSKIPSPEPSPATESVQRGGTVAAQPRTDADFRRLRAAKKLKENLQRRKQQQRSRRAGLADEAEGLPAANSTQEPE